MERDPLKTKSRRVHVAPPSSASEIMKAVGATTEDMRIVSKVLHELFPKQFPTVKRG